jgi:uncharacterized membrane protein (UPF0136 family)
MHYVDNNLGLENGPVIQLAKISLLVLSILMTFGGIIGFLKAQSKASLAAGLISGALLICSYSISMRNSVVGILFGIIIALLLSITFAIRLFKTRKFMPSGMLMLLCIIELLFLAYVNYLGPSA